jgi:hypothetical protein
MGWACEGVSLQSWGSLVTVYSRPSMTSTCWRDIYALPHALDTFGLCQVDTLRIRLPHRCSDALGL